MKIDLIHTGFFYADGGAMFGAVPKTAWQRRYACDEANGCVLAMSSLLVQYDNGRVILIDTGAGTKQLKQLSYYRFFDMKDLYVELRRLQIAPDQVTDVVLTHLHFDHCGYTTLYNEEDRSLSVAFPNARHWVSRSQWGNFLYPHPLEQDSYFLENMCLVEQTGLLCLIDEDTQLFPGFELELYDGHTPGQLAAVIKSDEHAYLFAGDVIPLSANLSPAWISAYDLHPRTSYDEKRRLLDKAVAEQLAVIYCHDAYTSCSTVKKVNGLYKKDRLVDVG